MGASEAAECIHGLDRFAGGLACFLRAHDIDKAALMFTCPDCGETVELNIDNTHEAPKEER